MWGGDFLFACFFVCFCVCFGGVGEGGCLFLVVVFVLFVFLVFFWGGCSFVLFSSDSANRYSRNSVPVTGGGGGGRMSGWGDFNRCPRNSVPVTGEGEKRVSGWGDFNRCPRNSSPVIGRRKNLQDILKQAV